MNSFDIIINKLEAFIKKYYTNELIKGIFLFVAFGLLCFLLITTVEYFFWLPSIARGILFWIFVAIETFLFIAFIGYPLFYLLKLKKGISHKDASLLIGKHFPDVDDKLINVIELSETTEKSELLVASIDQKSLDINPIPFNLAIDFKKSTAFAKYLIIPFFFILIFWLSGSLSSFISSYTRVSDYATFYEEPAPFSFVILNDSLSVLENRAFELKVNTIGDFVPEEVYIILNEEHYLLQKNNNNFTYSFPKALSASTFSLEANAVNSKEYVLDVIAVPSILDLKLHLNYPRYTGKKDEILNNTGSVTVPEGTSISWNLNVKNTNAIVFKTDTDSKSFSKITNTNFEFKKRLFNNINYQILTSNTQVHNFEKLEYTLTVVKDEYPKINAQFINDSINANIKFFVGEASDDYGIGNIELVYYPRKDENSKKTIIINKSSGSFNRFYYTYPEGLDLIEGEDYSLFFQVSDNDAVHKGKISKSQVFTFANFTKDELEEHRLDAQQNSINSLSKSVEEFKEQNEKLKEINANQRQQKELSFNDKNEVKDFLKRQKMQEKQMKKFTEQLKENLKSDEKEKDDAFKKLLQERLERQELEFKKNEELLKELDKIADKISKEDLKKKLEELGKKQVSNERNLEQILELTKRYYVIEKASKLQQELEKLAEKQEELSKDDSDKNNAKVQDSINKEFDKLTKEFDKLNKDNQKLKKPMDLNSSKRKEDRIKDDQKEALENLEKNNASDKDKNSGDNNSDDNEVGDKQKGENKKEAQKKQKSAAEKMKQMSDGMKKQMMSASGGETIEEDVEMLRKILDNLIVYSFEQEELMDDIKDIDASNYNFSSKLKAQHNLRELFTHVDDSLFALSLRRAELAEDINEEIADVYFNIDKALEVFADTRIYQGVSNQQFALTSSNKLASLLANIMGNMQMSMNPSQGSGEGKGFQLPDIIKSQEELNEKMKKQGEKKGDKKEGSAAGDKPGDKKGDKPGDKPGDGKEGKGKPGSKGKSGKKGEGDKPGEKGSGKSGQGKSGKQGKGGQQGKDGKQGKNGVKGKGSGQGNGGNSNSPNGEPGGEGEGQGKGKTDKMGNGFGETESESKELFEIYKQQQKLRNKLEDQLKDIQGAGAKSIAKNLIKQMESVEDQLLDNGIRPDVTKRMENLKHQLLKLQHATVEQGKDKKRNSKSNTKRFAPNSIQKNPFIEEYLEQLELLNRQVLPLQNNYKKKVNIYFKSGD